MKPRAKDGVGAPSQARYRAVLKEFCAEVGVAFELAHSRSRNRPAAIARMLAWRRLLALGFSTTGIGMAANRDHSTVTTSAGRLAAHEHFRRCRVCRDRQPKAWTRWDLCAACRDPLPPPPRASRHRMQITWSHRDLEQHRLTAASHRDR